MDNEDALRALLNRALTDERDKQRAPGEVRSR